MLTTFVVALEAITAIIARLFSLLFFLNPELKETVRAWPHRQMAISRGASAATLILVLAIGLIAGALAAKRSRPDSQYEEVASNVFPFSPTAFSLRKGDVLAILPVVTGSWNCGPRMSPPDGLADPARSAEALLPSANFCALIGRIGEGPYFDVGSGTTLQVQFPGFLSLGPNDAHPDKCAPDSCFADNVGSLIVLVDMAPTKPP